MSLIEAVAPGRAATPTSAPLASLHLVTPTGRITPRTVRVADVLLVDPSGSVPASVTALLARDGLVVTPALAAATVLDVAVSPTDLVLVHLAEGGAWADTDSCRQLRDLTAAPIVFVAEGPSLDHLVAQLDAGADEFITTFTRPHELLARLRAVLRGTRRAEPSPTQALDQPSPTIVASDGLEVDTSCLQVRLHGAAVHFSAREAQLLAALLRSPGRVVARHVLLDEVWGNRSSVSTKTLEKYVTAVRRRLEGHGVPAQCIAAVRGYGYRYAPSAATRP